MVTAASLPTRRRRRGAELEAALLEAAWDELVQTGYARLTMGTIATRAATSEAVLYRRWANKDELTLAAIEHYRRMHPVADPDTGALRSDLIALLTAISDSRAGYFAIAAGAAFSGLLADAGLTPTQARDRVMGDSLRPRDRAVFRRAHDRGEIDLQGIPAAVLALPFDLARHDLIMDLGPLKPARIRSIVDELFLPLVRAADRG
ncbi:TetR/AcrR family transcriptional regulator [Microbacterium protaetiae]|uniref:TetR/AcrR family transcriptional regulator n=1 Tax=Microbacterium protaetiae TaxID=2509458 RepID=A0A4V0YD48_9MICO|nr:TetR/AcrR family transcriptional regulator [Microbacterium protaetiae]QAY59461.1 TetR/AcrR family transcriptional regulator [Microbacterium protaetiae]